MFCREEIMVPEMYIVTAIVITGVDCSSCLAKTGSKRAGYSFYVLITQLHCSTQTLT